MVVVELNAVSVSVSKQPSKDKGNWSGFGWPFGYALSVGCSHIRMTTEGFGAVTVICAKFGAN